MGDLGLIPLIYKDTLEFLEERGYLPKLRSALIDESVDARMKRIDIKSNGLDIVDAVHCVLDRNRTLAFMNAIEQFVKPKDIVVEAGAGSGILAIFAAALQANVYGIEINKDTLGLAQDLAEFFVSKRILDEDNLQFVLADACLWEPPEKINVLISENICAGMFYEMQIPIVNHFLEFLDPMGKVIPHSMRSYVILTNTNLPKGLRHGSFLSKSEAEGRIYTSKELSDPIRYDEIYFHQENHTQCRANLMIPIKKSGFVNSLLIYSTVTVLPNLVLQRQDMSFLGEDMFIAIDPPIKVNKGSKVSLNLVYKRGGEPEDGSYKLSSLKYR